MKLEVLRWNAGGTPGEAALRASLEAEGYSVLSWTDRPGATYEPHSHDHDESLWLIRGEMTFRIAGDTYCLGAGDRLMLPRGTVHSAVAGSEGAAYLVGDRA